MRVVVDSQRCESSALCVAAAPTVFRIDDDERLQVIVEFPDESLRGQVEQAASRCPMQAITIEETSEDL
jgi:ferredoxin